tara:strand:+ start:93 stop:530 length:438 start_codon:yes stop_codon:yes gene_type:complete
MNWKKLRKPHYHKDPVEYIYATAIFDLREYDSLYENQNNLSHQVWQDFDAKYKTGYEFLQDIQDLNLKKEVICLWFFKDRNDKDAGVDIDLSGKLITYFQNTFLITESKKLKILKRKKFFPNRPVLQIDLSKKIFAEITEPFKDR